MADIVVWISICSWFFFFFFLNVLTWVEIHFLHSKFIFYRKAYETEIGTLLPFEVPSTALNWACAEYWVYGRKNLGLSDLRQLPYIYVNPPTLVRVGNGRQKNLTHHAARVVHLASMGWLTPHRYNFRTRISSAKYTVVVPYSTFIAYLYIKPKGW